MDNMNLALILLLAGFVIVFFVLILLIFIITIYGKIVQKIQQVAENRKKKQVERNSADAKPVESVSVAEAVAEEENGEIPGEIIAVIAAAIDAVYGKKSHKIKSVKRSRSTRSAWGNAGTAENTRPF